MSPGRIKNEAAPHRFGGDWTTTKLDIIAAYLHAYTTALRNQPFRLRYIDAFAGTGYREASISLDREAGPLLFPDLAQPEAQRLLEGSVRLALKTEPPFHEYIFIEQNAQRHEQLQKIAAEFPELRDRIEVRRGDANTEVRALCQAFQPSDRAVLFLDPYGMDVEWQTIEAVARTRAVDLWLLFPLGIGLNRLLTRSGDIPDSWKRRVTLFLGTPTWYEEFYSVEQAPSLFGGEEQLVKAKLASIGTFFNQRLASIFAAVAPHPLVLRNSFQ